MKQFAIDVKTNWNIFNRLYVAHLDLPEPSITWNWKTLCFANCSSDRSLKGQEQAGNYLLLNT